MDVDALHALTLGSGNAESSVTVNQRALIDKVLARYSSENTLLRELLQNSDDANATHVKIIYESRTPPEKGLPQGDLNKRLARRVIVKNDGQVFRTEDWSRLSRIAEGNPDEAKIGAFGVGFYSVFSICEDPFVTSGDTGLAFYWRNDQLFTKSAKLPAKDSWTSFSLNMRQDMELPNLRTLTKFLATSLTFSRSLANIELWLDDLNLCTVRRVASAGQPLAVPTGLQTTTSGGMLKINHVESSSVQIIATYLNSTQAPPTASNTSSKFFSFFSSGRSEPQTIDPIATTTSNIFLRVLTGSISSCLKQSFANELQRATKKPPPKQTKIQLVTVSAAEYAASTTNAPIFENLLTFPNQGRIFIGFPTHQTTGFAGHVGAPCIIPTVERESIDLVDRFIKLWNFEVLRSIGLLARIAYHIEFGNIKTADEAIHTLRFFSMKAATPQSINQTIEPTFFESSNSLPIFSSKAVQTTRQTRLPDPRINFLTSTPILTDALPREVPEFISRLKKLGYMEGISIGDIKKDLQDRVLPTAAGVYFLKYCADIAHDLDVPALSSLLRAGTIDPGESAAPFNAGLIKTFIDSRSIPREVPLPPTCAPHSITTQLTSPQMRNLGWQEITVLEWLEFVATSSLSPRAGEKSINSDPDYAALVLSVVSKNFDAMSTEERAQSISILRARTCIPTKSHGMQRPDQTYFHTIKMFDDLPLILSMKGVKERFLAALGVRKTIELNLIFDRLVAGGRWTAYDVITYLASVRKDIPAKDIERLRTTPLATAENHNERRLVSQLYEPLEVFRQLQLPVVAWPKDKWKPHSEESSLLFALGLQRHPNPGVLIEIAASAEDIATRERALTYFTTNFVLHSYGSTYTAGTITLPFIPTESGKLEVPSKVYINPASAIFGFETIRKDLVGRATMLGVQNNPPVELLLRRLISNPPQTHNAAAAQFQLIAQMQPNISEKERKMLSEQAIIPIEKKGRLLRMVKPNKCFFTMQGNAETLYREIFDFVDFGVAGNVFLRTIGVRDEPSTTQIAGMLVTDALNVWTICGSEVKYMQLLTQVAQDMTNVKKDRHLFESMKHARILIAYKHVISDKGTKTSANTELSTEGEASVIQTSLQRAIDVVIVDDVIDYELFKTDVNTCPQNIHLELLYASLGSLRLSGAIVDRPMASGRIVSNDITRKLKTDLIERVSVFFSDPSIQLKRKSQFIADHLEVVMQERVSMQRELKFAQMTTSRHVKLSAVILQDRQVTRLVISPTPDNYDVAVAICKLMLENPKPGHYLLLDTLLTKSLKTLKTRGYNVDRILQKHEKERQERVIQAEADARQAEIDQAATARAAQQRSIDQQLAPLESKKPTIEPSQPLPGSFPTSPPIPSQSGFMSNIRKGLGFNKPNQSNEQIRPVTAKQLTTQSQPQANVTPGTQIQAKPRPEEGVTSQASINKTLQDAIKMTRSSDDHSLFSTARSDQVVEARSFCDVKPAHDLVLAATLPSGCKFFCDRASIESAGVIQGQMEAALAFAELLRAIGHVFNVNAGAISIFYDAAGPTIAFNRTGTIYCNLRYYGQLHRHPSRSAEAATYWFVTMAHELAHNLVSEHSSEHEFYMESMVVTYLPRLMPLLEREASAAN